jgi:hypothetical protein
MPADVELKCGRAAHKDYELDALFFQSPMGRAALADVIARSYHMGSACLPLALDAAYTGERVAVQEQRKRAGFC